MYTANSLKNRTVRWERLTFRHQPAYPKKKRKKKKKRKTQSLIKTPTAYLQNKKQIKKMKTLKPKP